MPFYKSGNGKGESKPEKVISQLRSLSCSCGGFDLQYFYK